MKRKIILTLVAVTLLACLALTLWACNKASSAGDGTYYELKGSELIESSWVKLKGGKWEDDEGEKGTYKLSGTGIKLCQDGEELFSGSLVDGKLTIKMWGMPIGVWQTKESYNAEKSGTGKVTWVDDNGKLGMAYLKNKDNEITWDNNPYAASYTYELLCDYDVIDTGTISATNYTFDEALPAGEYELMVRANGDGVNYTNSESRSITIKHKVLPAVTSIAYNKTTESLSWGAVADVDGYKIYVDENLVVASCKETSYVLSDLVEVGQHTAEIYAFKEGWISSYGSISFMKNTLRTPYDLRVRYDFNTNGYVFSWGDVNNADSYQIYANGNFVTTVEDATYTLPGTNWVEDVSSKSIQIRAVDSDANYLQSQLSNGIEVKEKSFITVENENPEGGTTTVAVSDDDAYTITLDYNYEGCPEPIVMKVAKSEDFKFPILKTEHGTLLRWCEDKSCTRAYDFSQGFGMDTTLYAAWFGENDLDIDFGKEYKIDVQANNTFTFIAYVDSACTLTYRNGASEQRTTLSILENMSSIVWDNCITNTSDKTLNLDLKAGKVYYIDINRYSKESGGDFYFTLDGTRTPEVKVGGANSTGAMCVDVGAKVVIGAKVNDQYALEGVYDGKTKVSSAPYVCTVGKASKTYKIKLTACPITVSANNSDAGSITLALASQSGKAELVATTNPGYTWLGWYDDDDLKKSDGNSMSCVVDIPLSTKQYQARWCKLTLTQNVNDFGSLSVLNGKYCAGDAVRLVATPYPGYTFVGWYDDGGKRLCEYAAWNTVMPSQDAIYTARFGVDTSAYPGLHFSDYGFTITGIDSGIKNVVIPDFVTSIGEGAFYGCSGLMSITIPEAVTSIGVCAFEDCSSLTSITIPGSVTSIGSSAFSGCYCLVEVYNKSSLNITAGSYDNGWVGYYAKNVYKEAGGSKLSTDEDGYIIYTDGEAKILVGYTGTETELALPDGITEIYKYAFDDCSSLTSITIPGSVTSIGYEAFLGCSSLTSVTFAEGSKLTGIGSSAFSGCSSLTSITIPESVTEIGNYAFSDCSSLTSITIPSGVTSIGSSAFYGCYRLVEVYNKSALNITAGSSNYGYAGYYAKNVYKEAGGSKFSTDDNGYIIYTDGKAKILVGYTGTGTALTLPAGITEIYKYAFRNCRSLTSITIPDSVTSIGSFAFYNCSSLTSITIPESVTSIGSSAFSGCSSLTSITIPDSVTSIGSSAFSGCSSLTSITLPFVGNTINGTSNTHFRYIFGASSSNVPTSLKTVVITKATSIGEKAFEHCSSITSITIPSSVTSIGERAFSWCSSLTSVTFAEGSKLTGIGNYAFEYCSSLTCITVPEGVTSIGEGAFSDCISLTSVTFAEGSKLTGIGSCAFSGCVSLTSITIPSSVKSIGDLAFSSCLSLTSITYKGTKAQWNAITKGTDWNYHTGAYTGKYTVRCTDGNI